MLWQAIAFQSLLKTIKVEIITGYTLKHLRQNKKEHLKNTAWVLPKCPTCYFSVYWAFFFFLLYAATPGGKLKMWLVSESKLKRVKVSRRHNVVKIHRRSVEDSGTQPVITQHLFSRDEQRRCKRKLFYFNFHKLMQETISPQQLSKWTKKKFI